MGGVYQGLGRLNPLYSKNLMRKSYPGMQRLASEMELFSSTNDKVTIDVIQKELTKTIYPQYYRMVQLALTLPVGTATAERSFSAMRRIRNYLRSTMRDERFSSLALLNIESDLTAALVPEDIVRTYANSGNRRVG